MFANANDTAHDKTRAKQLAEANAVVGLHDKTSAKQLAEERQEKQMRQAVEGEAPGLILSRMYTRVCRCASAARRKSEYTSELAASIARFSSTDERSAAVRL